MDESVTCRFCGQEHAKPRLLHYGGAFEDNFGGWWCRDGRACRRRQQARPTVQTMSGGETGTRPGGRGMKTSTTPNGCTPTATPGPTVHPEAPWDALGR